MGRLNLWKKRRSEYQKDVQNGVYDHSSHQVEIYWYRLTGYELFSGRSLVSAQKASAVEQDLGYLPRTWLTPSCHVILKVDR